MSKNNRYAIIDIETTGGMPKRDKITEIAIVIHDGEKVIDQFDSLINPERSIPYEITRITGITDDMVADAPKFYEVAKQVVQMTEGAIFVAHNVRFDYGFIQQEFDRLGFTYSRKQLCTVRLARKAFPGLKSYSLGNLIQHFGIKVNARHRALDDTLATVELFEHILLQNDQLEESGDLLRKMIKEQKLPEAITLEMLEKLPDETGVYYFYNNAGKVVYVGKSINIRKRVMQHFSKITAKSSEFIKQVKDISFELTGSELIALLLESEEIKSLQPIINKAQRTKEYPYFIHVFYDHLGYITFDIEKTSQKRKQNKTVLAHYASIQAAKSAIGYIRAELELCDKKMLVRGKTNERCLYFMMKKCLGACQGLEESSSYNERAELGIQMLRRVFNEDFFIVTTGRSKGEKAIVLVENGNYQGFGFIPMDGIAYGIEEMKEAIDYKRPTEECNGIISNYLQTKSDYEIIKI